MGSIPGLVVESMVEHLDCHMNLQNNVNDLRKIVTNLRRRRSDKVAELLTMDDSEEQVKEEVQGWLEDAGRVIEIEMPRIEDEVQNVSSWSRGRLGKCVRRKIQEVEEIYNRGSFPKGLVIKKPSPIGHSWPVENLEGEVDVKREIWGYLRGHEFGMIGLCGIGGVGKTTIMMHINNDLLKESIVFDKVIWVTVSHPLNIAKLQHDIARKMGRSLREDWDELERLSGLMKIMETVKYALILDDVWDKFTLRNVGIPEPTRDNGCKVVITSRSVDVCKHLNCRIVKVPTLSEQESLNLFLDKVGRNVLQIPRMEGILKPMVAECAGLPLAIVVIAGSMKGVTDIREWSDALRELSQCVVGVDKDSEGEIFNRLKFSYDRLRHSSIQNCFLYCSLYSEDYEIRREDLIENWICEGLVEKLDSRSAMHHRGHVILNRLENNCLLEKVYKDEVNEFVKMHDVVRDMALRIKSTSPGGFMVKAGMGLTKIPNEDEWNENLDKVSLMGNKISYIPINMSPRCLMLSTLTLEGTIGLREIPECFFANMPQLKFLNLSYTDIETLPNSVCNLENLTTLILRRCCHLERMPSLAKLKALKKLDLDQASLVVAPEGIEMLENLEYLDLSCPKLMELPAGIISKLFCLQYLRKHKIFPAEIKGEEVARLKMLECFKGGFEKLKDFNSFVSKSNHFGSLRYYRLTGGTVDDRDDNLEWYFGKFSNTGALNFNKRVTLRSCERGEEYELVLPDNLQDLSIEYCNPGTEWVVSSSSLTVINNLEVLVLLKLDSLRDVVKVEKTTASLAPTTSPHIFSNLRLLRVVDCPKLNKLFPCELLQGQVLPNLEQIEVYHCQGIEYVVSLSSSSSSSFPVMNNLEKLSLGGLPSLRDVVKVGKTTASSLAPTIWPHSFSNLKQLYVNDCSKLNKLFPCELLQGQVLPNLEQIEVKHCWGMEEIIGWDEEEEGNQTTTTAIFTLPKLRILDLRQLPKLKRICPERGVMVCHSLNSITIEGCYNVKRIPFCLRRENGQPSLLAVKEIFIENQKEWWEWVEWRNPDDKNVLLPFLQYDNHPLSGGSWVRIKYSAV